MGKAKKKEAEDIFADLDEAEKFECERSYAFFFRAAWLVVEPESELLWNWHMDYLCDLLQKEIERIAAKKPKTQDILINIPPRALKSSIVTIFLNAWAWTRFPWLKFITGSYSADLANRHAMKTRMIIESEWYRSKWNVVMRRDQNRVSIFENVHGGFRKAVGVGGGIAGEGADVLLTDDPVNPAQSHSVAVIEGARDWWDMTFQNRLNDHRVGLRGIIMQRLADNDPTGHVLQKNPGAWKHICIPGEDSYPVKPEILKANYQSGLFFPERFSREDLKKFRIDYGGIGYANQIGQAPIPSEGAIYKKEHFLKRWKHPLPDFYRMAQSWDLTFTETGSSFVVGQVWGIAPPNLYLVHQVRAKMGYTSQVEAIQEMRRAYPQAIFTLVEQAANGFAVIETLRKTLSGIKPWPARGSKEARASATTQFWDAGNVYIPENADWVETYIAELMAFPRGTNDDQVDCTSQFLNWYSTLLYQSKKSRQPVERIVETTRV